LSTPVHGFRAINSENSENQDECHAVETALARNEVDILLISLLDRVPLVSGVTAKDVAGSHDDYLYGGPPKQVER
jgi:hypothetical protein